MSGLLAAIEAARHAIAGAILVAGLLALLAAIVGQARFPDVFTRLHAASLVPLGFAAVTAGLAVEAWSLHIAARLALLGALILALAPARAHMLASAAHAGGLTPLVGEGLRASAAPPREGA